ncbi:response regulator transcription factor [Chloroflexota bacterium]
MEKKTSILVVDDEEIVRQLLKQSLETEGFAVTMADNGNSALALLAKNEPAIVLLDIRMPGLDGYQVLERIRKTSNVPVLMLTGLLDETAAAHSFDLGADDYIRKPFHRKTLVARIRAKLRRARGDIRRL